jgi:ribonucleoside-diphosphate reductase alpha chain
LKYIESNNKVTQRGEDGFFQLEQDQIAIQEYLQEIKKRSPSFGGVLDRLHWLIEHDFYENVFDKYTDAQVKYIHDIADSYDFKFKSFMQAFKFYNDYALRTNDKKSYLESFAEHNAIVALHLGKGDVRIAKDLIRSFMEQRYQPATPTYLNAGRSRRGEMVSCFLLAMDDSTNSIQYNLTNMAQLSRLGGGVACDLSNLRAMGDPIKGIVEAAKGIIPVAKLMEDTFSYYDQMGQRKGSGAAYSNVFHLDAGKLLDTKKINADDNIRLKTLSIGLIVPNIFYDLAEADKEFYGFSPYDIYKYYGMRMTEVDFDVWYHTLAGDSRVRKEIIMNARDFLNKIAQIQLQSGYPYIVNITNANKGHALSSIGRVTMSNLCTEIFQLQEISEIKDYDLADVIKRDISCNLGSLNITNVMERKAIKESVHEGIGALMAVSLETSIDNAPGVRKANEELHSVGLGAMDLHGFLAKNNIMYESFEARDFARTFFMMMNYYSIEKSMMIAKEERIIFKDFNKTSYASGSYFEKYISTDYRPKTGIIAKMFEGMDIPTPKHWADLQHRVAKHGMANAYRLAIAPTQSISYVQNATSCVLPLIDLIETRTYANSKTFYPAPHLRKDNQWYFKSAYNTDMLKVIDMIAVIQEHVDQGISTVLFVKSDVSTAKLSSYYIYAAKKGLKSLYYTRAQKQDVKAPVGEDTECVACSV